MPVKILVVGSLNMDLVATVEALPQVGETLTGKRFDTYPGGKGANQAVAAARMGASVAMLGAVGSEDYGRRLLDGLTLDDIDVSGVAVLPGVPTGTALITVSADGHNTIIVIPGANGAVQPADLDAAADAFEACEVVVLQLELPMAAVVRAAALARSLGKKVVLNPAPFQPMPQTLISLVDVLVVNEIEGLQLSGLGGGLNDNAQAGTGPHHEEVMDALVAQGYPVVLMTLGAEGVLYTGEGLSGHVPAATVKAVDTTAAGDTFTGTFAAFWPEVGLERAVALAVEAAGIAVTRPGAQTSIPYRRELSVVGDRD
ncbi:ribokinase [Acidaminobacter hydrogenoformans]|uniref:Ribokinase n=1 Tax=Acidaminobacter hydrogenoformans DSM 2784 TaxID=1120920 RepID=A0A1G5RW58_9FIRM|nr:ribokinase [Acidaminobacter hydrogenoformans]SCZ77970.1 ribokinase [Acidaminobacter hydrogenoformans DSM 2784]